MTTHASTSYLSHVLENENAATIVGLLARAITVLKTVKAMLA
jgi:hypothetical protein